MKLLFLFVLCAVVASFLVEGVTVGQSCEKDSDCDGDNTDCNKLKDCTKGTCVCKKWYHWKNNACTKYVKLGDTCNTASDCNVDQNIVACTNSKCVCKDSAYEPYSETKMHCIKKSLSGMGGSCSGPHDCKAYFKPIDDAAMVSNFATCTGGVCACSTGSKASGDECKPLKNGDSCTGSYCAYTPCRDGVCQCTVDQKYLEYYVGNGQTNRGCVHKDATTGLGKGELCQASSYLASAKFCKDDYACRSCPESPTVMKCISGASSVIAGFIISSFACFTTVALML